MAQHISILQTKEDDLKSLVSSLQNRFHSRIKSIKTSLKFIEMKELEYKLHSNDLVFQTVKTVRNKKETLEIHYNIVEEKISDIFIVK